MGVYDLPLLPGPAGFMGRFSAPCPTPGTDPERRDCPAAGPGDCNRQGGYVPARVVCDELLTTHLTSIRLAHWGPAATRKETAEVLYPLACSVEGMDLLVIDDVTDTGETLSAAMHYLHQLRPARIRTGVLHHKISSGFTPDYYAELVTDWRWIIYPWALHEDLSGFLARELTPQPVSLAYLQEVLQNRYTMQVSSQDLFNAAEDLVRMHRAVKHGELYLKPDEVVFDRES